jgi:hypothetical protein
MYNSTENYSTMARRNIASYKTRYLQNFVKALRRNQRLPTGTFPRSLLEDLPAKLFHGANISNKLMMGHHWAVVKLCTFNPKVLPVWLKIIRKIISVNC